MRNLYTTHSPNLFFILDLSSRYLRHYPFEKHSQVCNQTFLQYCVHPPTPQTKFWGQYPSLPEDSKNLKIVSSYRMINALISSSTQTDTVLSEQSI